VSRSYYRGAAGAILVYDITSHPTFTNLQPFLNDARALASPNLTLILAGNKVDLADSNSLIDIDHNSGPTPVPSSYGSTSTITAPAYSTASVTSTTSRSSMATEREHWGGGGSSGVGGVGVPVGGGGGFGAQRATIAPDGREVSATDASRWASGVNVPVTMEVSAFTGEGVDEVFARLARMILTKIELGEIDPDDPMSGIQYGDAGGLWHNSGASTDGASIKSSLTADDIGGAGRRSGGWGREGVGGGLHAEQPAEQAGLLLRFPVDLSWKMRGHCRFDTSTVLVLFSFLFVLSGSGFLFTVIEGLCGVWD
jgi:GTPase SAR1 family protein